MPPKASLVSVALPDETSAPDNRPSAPRPGFCKQQSLPDVSVLGGGWEALKPVLPATDVAADTD